MTQSRGHILVVDDERNIRTNLTMVLEAEGYTVDATSDGEETLAKCRQRPYDITFVDIQTPKIGGFELIRYIRDLCKEATVVMLSQYGTMAKGGRSHEARSRRLHRETVRQQENPTAL
jgi:two-component system, NtrC family, nitrogen regulation response regulator NtrX